MTGTANEPPLSHSVSYAIRSGRQMSTSCEAVSAECNGLDISSGIGLSLSKNSPIPIRAACRQPARILELYQHSGCEVLRIARLTAMWISGDSSKHFVAADHVVQPCGQITDGEDAS